jgi:hypothetical protein
LRGVIDTIGITTIDRGTIYAIDCGKIM